ncbi:MAG TPA: hypothetical protein VFQ44_10615 [Streptosporangiaceae bacterium]|nr:hypothetical protein [Streptosporangiaceae bacterium]
MLRIVRGTDCYWVVGEYRIARVSLSGGAMDWPVFDRQTKLVQAADAEAAADGKLLPLVLENPARTAIVTAPSALTLTAAAALERAGVGYAQITLDGRTTCAGAAFEPVLASLRLAASCGSLLWHVRIALTCEPDGIADTLLKMLGERMEPSRPDVSFAFGNEPADDGCLPAELAERIARFYLRALTQGFNVRLPSCHRCATCDSRGGRTTGMLNTDGLCTCGTRDHCSDNHDQLNRAVHSAIVTNLYQVCGLEHELAS